MDIPLLQMGPDLEALRQLEKEEEEMDRHVYADEIVARQDEIQFANDEQQFTERYGIRPYADVVEARRAMKQKSKDNK